MFDKIKSAGRDYLNTDKPVVANNEVSSFESKSYSGVSAMIGPGVKIEGQIISDENLVIEGKVNGSITAKNHEVR